jgi:ABC-type Fe3+/spermidine/putrescine transport system ATPase subunit
MIDPEADSGRPSLQLEHLTVKYRNRVAVNDLSVEVTRGSVLALLGPSGCGKTTVLMAIAGFVTPSDGGIYIDGREMTPVPASKRRLGVVFQDYALFPHLTVRDNVAFGLRVSRTPAAVADARIDEVLRLTRLEQFAQRRPPQLSGGQRQRVALARALAPEPRLLLLDEPLSSLDVNLRQRLLVELRRIQRVSRVTMIYVTHDSHEAFAMASNVIVMRDGHLVQSAAPIDLYDQPDTEFVAALLGDVNRIRGRLEGRNGSLTVQVAGGRRLPVGSAAGSVAAGAEVSLVVRPEDVKLRAASSSAKDDLLGTVVDASYAGGSTNYSLETSLGLLTARVSGRHAGLVTGAQAAISWAADSSRAVIADLEDA